MFTAWLAYPMNEYTSLSGRLRGSAMTVNPTRIHWLSELKHYNITSYNYVEPYIEQGKMTTESSIITFA